MPGGTPGRQFVPRRRASRGIPRKIGQVGGGIENRAQLDGARGERIATLAQLAVMAAIVATLIYFPLVAVLGFALRAAGVSVGPVATFALCEFTPVTAK